MDAFMLTLLIRPWESPPAPENLQMSAVAYYMVSVRRMLTWALTGSRTSGKKHKHKLSGSPKTPPAHPKPAIAKKTITHKTNRLPNVSLAQLAEMLRAHCQLQLDDFDSRFDFTYTDGQAAKLHGPRGGELYLPPKGFNKLGLNVKKRFPKSNGKWLRNGSPDCWPIVYHGTRAQPSIIRSIIRDGFKIRGGKDIAHNGQRYGAGIYCSPDPEYAVCYAREHKLDLKSGDKFVVVFQCRVKPGEYIKEGDGNPAIWRLQDATKIRPYAVLLSSDEKT